MKTAAVSLDITGRADVHKLRRHAIGLGGVLFISFAAMSPLTGQLGNVPIALRAARKGAALSGGVRSAAGQADPSSSSAAASEAAFRFTVKSSG